MSVMSEQLNLVENASLQTHNTMAVPAIARYLVTVNSVQQLRAAIEFAQSKSLQTLMLGEGSNTLLLNNQNGLVVLNRIKCLQILEETKKRVRVRVGAGENWHDLVSHSVTQGWHGLENLALIPGLVGAAPIQNIGAYGSEFKDCFDSLEFYNYTTHQVESISRADCRFAYRDSIFKHELRNVGAIVSVTLNLKKSGQLNLTYPALREYFEGVESVSLKQVYDGVVSLRQQKLPLPSDVPNLGSFFKNPIVPREQYQHLLRQHQDIVAYPVGQSFKLAAAWLIEKSGWKSESLDGVSVYEKQALVMINPERQGAAVILQFAQRIQNDIKARYAVDLEIEPQVY